MNNALAIHSDHPPLPPAPRGVGYIDLATAAKRWGCEIDSFRKRHLPRFIAKGFARRQSPAEGGAPVWQVREDADARLARVRPVDLRADLTGLSDSHRLLIRGKVGILQAWEDFADAPGNRGLTRDRVDSIFVELLAAGTLLKLAPGMKLPAVRTLQSWRAAYRRDGESGLIDERSTRQRKPTADDPFFEFFADQYLDQRQRTIHLCWELSLAQAAIAGWMTRSYSQTNRFEKTIPNAVKVLRRQGPKAFNDMSAGYIQRDYSGLRSNQLWNADHHRFDVMVRHDGRQVRPWLTAFQDVRSRKIVGWHISAVSANSDTIMLALRAGIVGHGIPEEFLFDNGKDFHCSAIQGRTKRQLQQSEDVEQTVTSVCAGLEIKVTHCWPYHGQSKPIERFFGTCESRFGKLQSTYCGNSTANKPENLAAKLDRGAAPTLAEFIEAFGAWLEGDYHCAPHTGDAMDGRTPAQVFDECLEVKRVADSSALEVMLWKPSQQKVGRIGVRCGGLYYGKDELRLIDWAGKEVVVRSDPADVSRVAVCRPDGSLICIAPSNDKLPFRSTAEEAREAIADLKKNARAVKNYHRARPRLHQDPAGRMYEQRAAKAKAEREAAPPPAPKLTTIATPMDDQLPLLERAMQANAANTPPSEQRPRFSIYANPPETELKLPSFREIGRSIAEKMRRQHEEEEEDRAAEDRATIDAFFALGAKLRKEAASG